MYNERKESFTLKDLLIQVLFVGVFIFLLVWLFPLKSDVNKKFDSLNDSLNPLYDQIFNQNIMAMKESAITYFTTPRLPSKVGEEKKMTLSEMLSENIILPFVDKEGNQCDLLESYVSMTKMSDEYILKINLKCGNQEDYLLVHLGCYDYCDGNVCEKEEPKEEPEPQQPQQQVTPQQPQKDPEPQVKPQPEEYLYEYVKITDGKWGEYGAWSDWAQNVITKTDYRDVETKTETKTEMTTKTVTKTEPVYEKVKTGTKREAYTAYKTKNIYDYEDVVVGTKEVEYEETEYKWENVQVGTKKVPHTTTTYTYEDKYEYQDVVVRVENALDCTNTCKMVQKPVTERRKVKVGQEKVPHTTTTYTEEPVYEMKKVPYTVTKTRTEDVTERRRVVVDTEEVPYTAYRTVDVYETVQTGTKEVTETVEVPVETTITLYRSRTREYISGSVDTKWSKSQNDQKLLEAGYTLTGNSKKA